MKHLYRIALAGMLLAAPLAVTAPVEAAVALVGSGGGTGSNTLPQTTRIVAFGDVTTAQSFATTAYADVAGSSITFTPLVNDETTTGRNSGNFPGRVPAGLIKVDWSFDVSKATATVITCAVYANGAVIAGSARSAASAGGQDAIGGAYVVSNTVVGAQTLKLQCKSGDTNIGTLNAGHVIYSEILPG